MLTITLFVIIITSLTFYWKLQVRKYKDIEKLPGPPAWELVWLMFQQKSTYEMYKYMLNLGNIHGPVTKLWIKPFSPQLVISDPKYIEPFFSDNIHSGKTRSYDFLKPYVGNGLATSAVDVWKKDRKLLSTAFRQKFLEDFTQSLNYHEKILIDVLKTQVNKPVDMTNIIHLFALDVLCDTVMKIHTDFQTNPNTEFLDCRTGFFSIYLERAQSALKRNDFLFRFTSSYKKQEKYLKVLKKFSDDMIRIQRDAKYKQSRSSKNYDENVKSLLDILFESNMESERIRNQVDTFVVAGHDTTATTLCFTLFEIAKYPQIQKKILDEVVSITGKDKEATITFSQIQEMKYTECVLKESLRIHPTVPFIERVIGTDVIIDGVMIPKGTNLTFAMDNLHNSEKYFPNPTKFDPDRFLPENEKSITPYSYIPFSIGPRNCIGKNFALLEMKSTLAKLVKNFELHPVTPEHELQPIGEMILKSRNGFPVIFKIRNI